MGIIFPGASTGFKADFEPKSELAGRFMNALNPQPENAGFSPKTPQQWLEYQKNLEKQGYAPEKINSAMQQFVPTTNPNSLESAIAPEFVELLRQNRYNNSPAGMKAQLELAREDAREKAKQQLMWGTLAKLPETIATAFGGGPNAQERFRQGMGAIPGIYANTLASYPQIQVPGSSTQQYRYFT
jgi:hypothetical protein